MSLFCNHVTPGVSILLFLSLHPCLSFSLFFPHPLLQGRSEVSRSFVSVNTTLALSLHFVYEDTTGLEEVSSGWLTALA